MDRRKFIKATGASAAGLSIAGCLGGGEESSGTGETNETDQGDEPVTPSDPGWFDITGEVADENVNGVKFTQKNLFRTSDSFGVRWTVKNATGQALTNLTIHVQLLAGNNSVLGEWSTTLSEVESIQDLAVNEKWSGDLFFEGSDPDTVIKKATKYQIWATSEAVGN